eukprot:4061717-Amphidinium_carterae.2
MQCECTPILARSHYPYTYARSQPLRLFPASGGLLSEGNWGGRVGGDYALKATGLLGWKISVILRRQAAGTSTITLQPAQTWCSMCTPRQEARLNSPLHVQCRCPPKQAQTREK